MHEINVIGTMNLFAAASQPESRGAQRGREVVDARLRLDARATRSWFTEETPPHGPAAPPRSSAASIEVEGYVRDFAADNPARDGQPAAVLQRARPRHRHPDHPGARAAARAVRVRLRPPASSSCTRTTSSAPILFVLDHGLARHLQRRRRRPAAVERGRRASAASAPCPLPPFGTGLAAAPLGRVGVDLPAELLDLLRYGRGVDNRRLKDAGFDVPATPPPARCGRSPRPPRLRRTVGATEPTYRYERDVEQFFRHSPAVVRD